jgi:heptosyltransferase-2
MNLKLDCRHFRGDKPCRFACGCEGCAHYAPMGKRILIVKLDAIGDVARTTTILRPLRAKYDPCQITWLVHPAAEEILRGNPLIDVVLPYQPEALEPLRVQRFDLVLSLDKTPRATAVATWSNAPEKLGFGLSEFGTVFPLNPEAEYAFQLGLDDDLKFKRNRKTYQEVLFEAIKLPYAKEEYAIEIDERDRRRAEALFEQWKIPALEVVVGLNLGGGSAFANKMWNAACATIFIDALLKQLPCQVLLFGAERERTTIEQILAAGRPNVLSAGTRNTIREFQALLARCAVVVTGDSLGMHLAIAEKRPVVVLFGPTCAQEIELYGRGEAIVAASPCAPCYRPECARNPSCMQEIEPGTVVAAVERLLKGAGGARGTQAGGE